MAMGEQQSPFVRLREVYENADARCGQCGSVDPDGSWRVNATGNRVRYERTCPSCGASATRELRL